MRRDGWAAAFHNLTAIMAKLTTPSRPTDSKESNFEELKQRIHGKLVDKLDLSRVGELEGDTLRREIRLVVEHLCDTEDTLLNRNERERLVERGARRDVRPRPAGNAAEGPDDQRHPHQRPEERLRANAAARWRRPTWSFRDNDHLMQIIDRIISKVGRRVDETCPMVDARMPDGSRFNAIIPPLALDGACVSIRRFGANPLKLEDLLNFKAFTPEMVMLLEGAIKARLNIIISGGTGSGKTTLLNTLSSFIPNTRPHRDHRGRGRIAAAAGPRGAAGDPAAEHRRQGRRSPPPTWCATPCVCGPNGSSSASAAAPKPSTCCRP